MLKNDPSIINIKAGGDVTIHLVCPAPEPKPKPYGRFTFFLDGASFSGESPMAITLPNDKPVKVKVTWLDAEGHPAQVDGDTRWESGDTSIMTAVADPADSQLAELTGADQLATTQVVAKVDADIGAGVQEIMVMADVTVVAGSAVTGTIEVVPSP